MRHAIDGMLKSSARRQVISTPSLRENFRLRLLRKSVQSEISLYWVRRDDSLKRMPPRVHCE